MNTKTILAGVSLCALAITGCVSPLHSSDPETRKQAVEKIADDKELFFIAMNVGVGIKDKWPELYDVTHLRREEYPEDVRVMAVRKIKNPEYLLCCASWKDDDYYVDPAFESGTFHYKGVDYSIDRNCMMRKVSPGDAVRKAAIERLSEAGILKDIAKCLGSDAKKRLFPADVRWDGGQWCVKRGKVRKDSPLDEI